MMTPRLAWNLHSSSKIRNCTGNGESPPGAGQLLLHGASLILRTRCLTPLHSPSGHRLAPSLGLKDTFVSMRAARTKLPLGRTTDMER